MDTKDLPVYGTTLTDAGGRRVNEDAVYTCAAVEEGKIESRGHLYIVADGTGAQEGGQTASSMATAIIAEYYYDDKSPDISESLKQAVKTAHQALYELAHKVPAWAEMSTTIVAAVVLHGTLYVAYVGDSRAYLIRDGESQLLTRDHVWLKDDDNYGALIRWVGGSRRPSVEVDTLEPRKLQEQDTLVLCSDGLTDVVGREDIQQVAVKTTPATAAKQLVDMANRRRTGDNISVAVIRYGGKVTKATLPRWVWLGAGAAAILIAGTILALVLTGGGTGSGGNGQGAEATFTPRPAQINLTVDATSAPTEDVAEEPTTESTRPPTSTPVPATDTPAPAPTRAILPTTPPEPAPTEPSGGGGEPQPTSPPQQPTSPPPPSPTSPPDR